VPTNMVFPYYSEKTAEMMLTFCHKDVIIGVTKLRLPEILRGGCSKDPCQAKG